MDRRAGSPEQSTGKVQREMQAPEAVEATVLAYLREHPGALVREAGKVLFDLSAAEIRVSAEHGTCALELVGAEGTLARRVVAAEVRGETLRLDTVRFGIAQTRRLELVPPAAQPREKSAREGEREAFLPQLERALRRSLPEFEAVGLRTAMDLERSFGPAYLRGTLVRSENGSREALALIGIGEGETQAAIDGILTPGVLWLEHLRTTGDGRRQYGGLLVVAPKGKAVLTQSRMRWMNKEMASWRLFEFDSLEEELFAVDVFDTGNLKTRLVHAPNFEAAEERFQEARERIRELAPEGEAHRVEERLRGATEMAFLLHGLPFARAVLEPVPGRFTHRVRMYVGVGAAEREWTETATAELRELVEELFRRRDPRLGPGVKARRPSLRGAIGASSGYKGQAVHARLRSEEMLTPLGLPEDRDARRSRLEMRASTQEAQRDPLFRASPERWLESVLRANLAPLTRGIGPGPMGGEAAEGSSGLERRRQLLAARKVAEDPDTIGNRAEPVARSGGSAQSILPRLDPRHVYAQVPAIAGAGDRGMLDLLGVTVEGRLAVIELKAADDLHHVLQALDYWVRVWHHHREHRDRETGLPTGEGELQRHGYFRGLELSPLPPRLYLVAPALHIHPATEVVLRYLDPEIEWTLLALDERWRSEIRVVWRRSGGGRRG